MKVELTVNGKDVTADVEDRTLLVHFLRDTADLTATNIGCDTTSCGACTVLLDGESVKSCTVLAAQADGRVGDHARGPGLRRPARCTRCSGRSTTSTGCSAVTARPAWSWRSSPCSRRTRRRPRPRSATGLEGNICRCTGYHNIVKAALARGLGGRSSDPSRVYLCPRHVRGRGPRAGGRARRGRQVPGRRPLAAAADEAAVRLADRAHRPRPGHRAVLRPRRGHLRGDRRDDQAPRRRPRRRCCCRTSRCSRTRRRPWATRRSGTAARSAARSRTRTRPPTCRPRCSRSTRPSWSAARPASRSVPAAEFFKGIFETALEPGELLTEIQVPEAGQPGRVVVPEVQQAGDRLRDRRRGRPGHVGRAGQHGLDAAAGRRRGVGARRPAPRSPTRPPTPPRAPTPARTSTRARPTASTSPASWSGAPWRKPPPGRSAADSRHASGAGWPVHPAPLVSPPRPASLSRRRPRAGRRSRLDTAPVRAPAVATECVAPCGGQWKGEVAQQARQAAPVPDAVAVVPGERGSGHPGVPRAVAVVPGVVRPGAGHGAVHPRRAPPGRRSPGAGGSAPAT